MLDNLGQIGTKEFLPQPVRLTASERDAIKAQCPLSSSRPSRGDPFPPVFVMETAENCASRDLAVFGEGMSVVTLQR